MQRVTITLEEDLLLALDALAEERRYPSRSEALRDIVRGALGRNLTSDPTADSYGTLSYVYDHQTRDLPARLVEAQHAHHELTIASLHVHLDHETCLEVAVLRGTSGDLQALADRMTSQRGVRFKHLHLVPNVSALPHSHHD